MRQVLFRIPWDGIPWGDHRIPIFGFGALFVAWLLIGGVAMWFQVRERFKHPNPRESQLDSSNLFTWLIVLAVIVMAPAIGAKFAPTGMPLYGYGLMLLLGLISAILLADWRARSEGIDPENIWDLAIWLFVPGIVGARIFYLIQYHDRVYEKTRTVGEALFATVNLTEGGIILYGALIGGAIGHFAFCYARKLNSLQMADIITPSLFIGIGFGRIGCLLNGCCFGDKCDLPWGISFPHGSVPFETLVQRGYLSPDALATPYLHPTQIYSALDGFLTAAITLWYHRHRRTEGDTLGLALIICPIARFLLEFVRGDEFGQWGTSLTISQYVSLGVLGVGLLFQIYLAAKARRWKIHVPDKSVEAARSLPAVS